MTKDEEFEAMKIVIRSLERRIEELEKNNRINAVSTPNRWDELRKQSKYNSTPFYLKTAIP